MTVANIELTIERLVGLLNTDGSFYLEFKKDASMARNYRLNPVVQLSQKNVNFLNKVEIFLSKNNIKGKKSGLKLTESKRAPCIKVQGIEQVSKFITLLETSETSFCGLKWMDFLLMKQIYSIILSDRHNTVEGRQEIIDLKFHLHVAPTLSADLLSKFKEKNLPEREIKPIPSANRLDRDTWEERHGFSVHSKEGKAKQLINDGHQKYYDQCNDALQGIVLTPDYVSGVLDGDGCLFRSKENDPYCQATLDTGNEALLLALSNYFQDHNPRFYATAGSQVYVIRRQQVILNVKNHIKKAPLMIRDSNKLLK